MNIQLRVIDTATPVIQRLATTSLPESRQQFVRQLSQSALQHIVNDTPVKSGRAGAAWATGLSQLGGQAPFPGTDPAAVAEGRRLGSASLTDSANATEVQATNSVNYITFLEYGTRRMAPRAIVRRTLALIRLQAASLFVLK